MLPILVVQRKFVLQQVTRLRHKLSDYRVNLTKQKSIITQLAITSCIAYEVVLQQCYKTGFTYNCSPFYPSLNEQ